ncbi:MAG TPA: hypothetical protein VHT73_12930 [Thermodesulfobacteriota bacterium]|nr:hypothetical protein [Thermodesulfobacteriota bacterium]
MPTQTIRGTVEQSNDRGIKIAGEWYNYSTMSGKTFNTASVGDVVELKVGGKSGNWIYEQKFLMRSGDTAEPKKEVTQLEDRETRMVRMSALKSAVEFVKNGKKVEPSDAIRVAKEFETYIAGEHQEEPGADVPF